MTDRIRKALYSIAVLFACCPLTNLLGQSAKQPKILPPVYLEAGKLHYVSDEQGNRVPDFSYCGYKAGEQAIPDAPVRVVVPQKDGDATPDIQSALDYVAALPPDAKGIRGAVLLLPGRYEVKGRLTISHSGVVLRGSGAGSSGTVLIAATEHRQPLVTIAGRDDRKTNRDITVTDAYVPVNALTLHLASKHGLKPGDRILVRRPSTQAWIKQLGTETFGGGISALGWKPGQRDLAWERTISAVSGDAITLDAPLTTALDTAFGGGTVTILQWPGRIEQAGVENLRCYSPHDDARPKDEDHSWVAVTLENVSDAWVRQVNMEGFSGSAVAVWETARRITVEDCKSLSPVSEIGGQRRYAFFTAGQQTLFQRLYAEYSYHDFSVGFCAAGPNAFVQCQSSHPYSFSGGIDSWASGILFDVVNIDAQVLSYANRGQDAQGAGWSAANSVFWNCTAARIDCYKPPTANNWAFGSWAQFAGDGYWGESNNSIQPRSLYYAQLAERLHTNISSRAQILPLETDASSSPTVQQAAALTAKSVTPPPQMTDWIDQAAQRQPIPVNTTGSKTITQLGIHPKAAPAMAPPMHIENGWLVRGNTVLTGRRSTEPWWMGSVKPYGIKEAKPAITRFVPGRTGTGLTDDLDDMTDSMAARHIVAHEHNYGLWYDRRRDDHERIRRMDGEVWPPFYELPFARSGEGAAWDGLSKYDLTKYNTWYWDRLKEFANLADQKGLVLVHQDYFQHNIIEAGAHYADFPWRPANNINNTGFPEPPPFAGDKRIFLAEQFYDTTHPVRKALHRAFIRQCLDNFKYNNGVIQFIGEEFTGPLHFVQFWIDNIDAWEKENRSKEIIGLSTTKDVQDAILADPRRAAVVNVIDIRYWHYQENGTAYAPLGGQSLAPRQHARLLSPKRSSFAQVYRAVREYRQQYPGKAVIYSADSYDNLGWAAFMGGGSLAAIPVIADARFLADAATMLPASLPGNPPGQWALANPGKGYIVYCENGGTVSLDLPDTRAGFTVTWINPRNGNIFKTEPPVTGGKKINFSNPQSGPAVLWISRL